VVRPARVLLLLKSQGLLGDVPGPEHERVRQRTPEQLVALYTVQSRADDAARMRAPAALPLSRAPRFTELRPLRDDRVG
jgi:hypothetical protein